MARSQNLVHIEHQYSNGLKHVFVSSACMEAHTHTNTVPEGVSVVMRGPENFFA